MQEVFSTLTEEEIFAMKTEAEKDIGPMGYDEARRFFSSLQESKEGMQSLQRLFETPSGRIQSAQNAFEMGRMVHSKSDREGQTGLRRHVEQEAFYQVMKGKENKE